MKIEKAAREFEDWVRVRLPQPPGADERAIDFKHAQMAGAKSAFPFLRASFFRWAQRWVAEAGELAKAPRVLAVGDLHVENFGTWRDAEERLIWGVNDFDEAWELPWTSDLVRLAVSASLAVDDGGFNFTTGEVCNRILDGYRDGLKEGRVAAFDLGEGHDRLRAMVERAFKPAEKFWAPFDDPDSKWQKPACVPSGAKAALLAVVPQGAEAEDYREQCGPYEEGEREPAGLGSLGRPRYCLVARNRFVREAKAIVPSALAWVLKVQDAPTRGERLLAARPRPDPYTAVRDGWIARRTAPDAVKVSLKKLKKDGFEREDEEKLFHAMGRETANVHLASAGAQSLADDVAARHKDDANWFEKAVKDWRDKVEEDWKAFAPKAAQE